MNKRQRKKRLKKQGYIIGADLSNQPDQTAYIPTTILHHIFSSTLKENGNCKLMDKEEHRNIYGRGIRKPIGLTAAGEGAI